MLDYQPTTFMNMAFVRVALDTEELGFDHTPRKSDITKACKEYGWKYVIYSKIVKVRSWPNIEHISLRDDFYSACNYMYICRNSKLTRNNLSTGFVYFPPKPYRGSDYSRSSNRMFFWKNCFVRWKVTRGVMLEGSFSFQSKTSFWFSLYQ